jgi:hypothetical protein
MLEDEEESVEQVGKTVVVIWMKSEAVDRKGMRISYGLVERRFKSLPRNEGLLPDSTRSLDMLQHRQQTRLVFRRDVLEREKPFDVTRVDKRVFAEAPLDGDGGRRTLKGAHDEGVVGGGHVLGRDLNPEQECMTS